MSREILFKAKRTDNGEWVEGDLIHAPDGRMAISTEKDLMEVNPETVCQYTGLTDKNGKRIWENDIVSNKWCFACGNSVVRFGEYKDFHMPETYQCGNLGFYLEHMNKKDNRNVRKDMIYFANKCEVIGNIFDNPELLEGSAE